MELLQKLSRKALPMTIKDIDSIDKLRVLQAAGLVRMQLPCVGAKKQFACLLSITDLGRRALRDTETASC